MTPQSHRGRARKDWSPARRRGGCAPAGERTVRIVDAVSELLEVSDPQIGPHVDYGRAVALTLRIQLLIDRHDQRHRPLVGALNNLALRLQEYVGVERLPIDDKSTETRLLLEPQGDVLERTRDALAEPPE